MTLSTIIFDFGGVLLRTEDYAPRRRWEEKFGLAAGTLEAFMFNSPVSRDAQLGKITWETAWQTAAAHFHVSVDEIRRAQQDFFAGDVLDRKLAAYLRRLKPHFTIGLLSNTWFRNGQTLLLQYGIADAFHFSVTSAELGVMKPDARIFEAALARANAQPAETVFVDDAAENVAAAHALGMHAIRFTDTDAVIAQLVRLTGIR